MLRRLKLEPKEKHASSETICFSKSNTCFGFQGFEVFSLSTSIFRFFAVVMETFDQCLADAKSVDASNFFSVKYARFLVKEKNFDKARDVLRDAIKNDKGKGRLV